MQIKKIRASGFAVCRQTETGNHYVRRVQMIVYGEST